MVAAPPGARHHRFPPFPHNFLHDSTPSLKYALKQSYLSGSLDGDACTDRRMWPTEQGVRPVLCYTRDPVVPGSGLRGANRIDLYGLGHRRRQAI
jgi:hypothetical protein